MNKQTWVAAVVAAILFGGIGYYAGTVQASAGAQGTSGSGTGKAFLRVGAGLAGGFGGATVGTVVQIGTGTFTVQLPSSTSSSATTGTKLVLVEDSTQVQQLETVPFSNIQVGQTVTVAGSANPDGSITAATVVIGRAFGRGTAGAQTVGQ